MGAVGHGRRVGGGDGPIDDPVAVVVEADGRACLREIEEHLRIDLGARFGVVAPHQLIDRGGRGPGGVEEPFERDDDQRPLQVDGSLPAELGHGDSFSHGSR